MKNLEQARNDLAYWLRGTCSNIEAGIESLELDETVDWEDEMLTASTELCLGCGWWHETCELVDEDGDDSKAGYCRDCREDL